jgi:alkylation response protein AidB-like acyl-CoA dehydrogenase
MVKPLQHVREIEAAREETRKPSFMTQLFAGEPDFSLLVPFPEQDPADRQVGDKFLAQLAFFLRERVDPREIERSGVIPRAVIDGLADLGALSMTIPKEYGGIGLSQTNYDRALTLVASHCNILALLLSVHQSIGVPRPLLLFGTEEQRRKWLPRLARGAVSAFALTEPQIGSDPANMQATASLSDDGTYYLINGEKLWCTNSLIAEIIILTAKVNGRVTAFVVEMDSPGVDILHRCSFMGCRGIENGWVRFRDVRVPAENVVGGVGKGLRVALTALNYGRVSVAAICLGMAQQVFPPTVDWARRRLAFGKPIGEHELNTQKLARMAGDLLAMRALIELVAGMVDRGRADFRVEAAITKLVCSERLWNVVDTAMQIRGGRGYETADSLAARGEEAIPIEQIFRDARLYLIGEGASEILKLFIAREVWDPHLKQAAPFFDALEAAREHLPSLPPAFRAGTGAAGTGESAVSPPKGGGRDDGDAPAAPYVRAAAEAGRLGAHYSRWYAERLLPDGRLGDVAARVADPDLRAELQYVRRTSRRLARVILQQMARYRTGLEERQAVVARLADVGIDLFTIAAVCSYADGKPESVPLARQVAADARERIEERFRAISTSHDDLTRSVGHATLDGGYNWLTEGSLA